MILMGCFFFFFFFGTVTEISTLLSISKISHRCHPIWFNRSLQSWKRLRGGGGEEGGGRLQTLQRCEAYDSNTARENVLDRATKESIIPQCHYHLVPAMRKEWNWTTKNVKSNWGRKGKNRHKEAGLSRGSSVVKIEPWLLRGLVTAAFIQSYREKTPNGRRRLWTPMNLQQSLIHHHCKLTCIQKQRKIPIHRSMDR